MIETAVQSPLVHAAIVRLLPGWNLSDEEVAVVMHHRADYASWAAEAEAKAHGPHA